jgi:hypothetical protein
MNEWDERGIEKTSGQKYQIGNFVVVKMAVGLCKHFVYFYDNFLT